MNNPSVQTEPQPKAPLPLSVAIVCKDNVNTIGRTLDSVRGFASEIIALDSGSTDGTLELLEQANATIYNVDWPGFIEQVNRALDKCTQPWVFAIDSDESIDEQMRGELRRVIARAEQSGAHENIGYAVNRVVWIAGKPLNHAWQPEWRVRLVRNGEARWEGYNPHYAMVLTKPGGRVVKLKGNMRHDSVDDGLAIFLQKQVTHSKVAAQALYQRGKRTNALRLCMSPFIAWARQMVIRQAFRDGWRGWAAASCTAAATLMKHVCLMELQNKQEKKGQGDA